MEPLPGPPPRPTPPIGANELIGTLDDPATVSWGDAIQASRELPLIVTFGFAGHRALPPEGPVAEALRAAFETVQQAVAHIADTRLEGSQRTLAQIYGGPVRLRMLTGQGPGADRTAIAAWQEADFS